MKTKLLLTIALLASMSCQLMGWNKPGHMVVGAIAYQHLKENSPGTIDKVVALLKKHPYYNSTWKAGYNTRTGDDKALYLFMMAAKWPDDARGTSYHHGSWHYINVPVSFTNVSTVDPPEENILKEITNNLETIKSNTTTEKDKAIALCWVFHLLGDLHQPLHNVALFSAKFPSGDKGGNSFFVKMKSTAATTIKLHALWDDIIINSQTFSTVKQKATDIKTDNSDITYDFSVPAEFETWSNDCVELAKTVVYKHNGVLIKSGSEEAGKALPAGYAAKAKKTAAKQMANAGVRLATIIAKNLGENPI